MKLVIAEKYSVAAQLAKVIGVDIKREGYFEGKEYLVSWCVGHLVELAEPGYYGDHLKKWKYQYLPICPEKWAYRVKSTSKKQYETLKKLMLDREFSVPMESLICATDAGREGELIFRLLYQQAGCTKKVERLWLSSLEDEAIREGFRNLRPASAYDNLYQSALCRQHADWLVGINCTRLFSILYGDSPLKIGRVQTPTLAMLVEKEEQIKAFKKEKYYVAHVITGGIDAASEKIKDIKTARELCEKCKGKPVKVISVKKENKDQQPPSLYDLTTIQQDANKIYGYTASDTLEYLQQLYEKKLCTYPRTDSRYLSEDMEANAERMYRIIRGVYPFLQLEEIKPDLSRILDSKKVTDHHAIIPTREIDKAKIENLTEAQRNILHLLSVRYLCAVSGTYQYETVAVELECEGVSFFAKGKTVLEPGWKEIYRTYRDLLSPGKDLTEEEFVLPDLQEGMVLPGADTKSNEHWTMPPKRYTESALLAAMERAGKDEMENDVERKGLGTPATRAQIIEKLVQDGMVIRDRRQMIPTEKGMQLIQLVPEQIKSPMLTAEWENELLRISKGESVPEAFMEQIRNMVEDLVRSYKDVYREKEENEMREKLGSCPNCGADVLSGKYGAYCAEKCGMKLNRARKVELTDEQVKDLLNGRRIFLKNLPAKSGGTYSAYYVPDGVEEYSYEGKDGKHYSGKQFKIRIEFPDSD
ncbi:MAG: DNA topoisomerase 3 [Lachnospiraceae bacterium]|nr:DNA topoisomerase 3 [Lachnospiraceae bacterium]